MYSRTVRLIGAQFINSFLLKLLPRLHRLVTVGPRRVGSHLELEDILSLGKCSLYGGLVVSCTIISFNILNTFPAMNA